MTIEERIINLEKEIEAVKLRNKKVELNKSWETSLFRIVSVAVLTYVVMNLVMFAIGVPNFYISAIIPTLGFVLSTQSINFLKKWWLSRNAS